MTYPIPRDGSTDTIGPVAQDTSITSAPGQTAVPVNQQLAKNPQLPQSPLGAYIDSQYAAQNAILRQQIAQQYADLLQQLGYVDPATGQFIKGSVETNADRTRADLGHGQDLADRDVTNQMQANGTLFSGIRGTKQAEAEYPFATQLTQLGIDTPLQLQQLYEKAGGLMDQYTLQNNQLLADAAARQAGLIAQSGGGLDAAGAAAGASTVGGGGAAPGGGITGITGSPAGTGGVGGVVAPPPAAIGGFTPPTGALANQVAAGGAGFSAAAAAPQNSMMTPGPTPPVTQQVDPLAAHAANLVNQAVAAHPILGPALGNMRRGGIQI